MPIKIFRDTSDERLEKKVNDWAAKEGRGMEIVKLESSIQKGTVQGTGVKGKTINKIVNLPTIVIWYEPKRK